MFLGKVFDYLTSELNGFDSQFTIHHYLLFISQKHSAPEYLPRFQIGLM